MRIIGVRERTIPIQSTIRNAWIDFTEMTCSVVAITIDPGRAGGPIVGYGFNSNGRYGQPGLLRERFIPRLLQEPPDSILDPFSGTIDPVRAQLVMMRNEKPGGHGERSVAVGVLDMALWDLVGKLADRPLAAVLAAREGRDHARRVPAYAAGGYYDRGKGTDGLREELRGYLDLGYDSVKIKVGGAPVDEDLRRIEVGIDVTGDASRLAVDANGRLDVERAIELGQALEPLGLRWYEEPVDPLDYEGHARVATSFKGPIATGENLFSAVDVLNLARHAGLRTEIDVLQMDPVLSYGLSEYLGMIEVLERLGWSRDRMIPHGGHLLNLHAAAGLGLAGIEAYPAVFRPFGGFGDGLRIDSGEIRVPDAPGLGVEDDAALFGVLRTVEAL